MESTPQETRKDQQPESEYPAVLTLREKIAYGLGDVGNGFLFDMGQLYLLKYFTDVVGLPAAVAGGVFLVAKIWDAFADVTVGTVIDHRKKIGPRGRFRPFMLWAALPLGILMVASFMIPDSISLNMQTLWAYLSYIIFGTVYSISNVAFGSMQPAMTRNSVERSQLASWRNMGSNVAVLISTVAFMPIVLMLPTERYGYIIAACVFGVLGVACQLYSYFNIKEHYHDETRDNVDVGEEETPKQGFKDVLASYKSVFHNGPLLILCLANLFTFSAYNVKLAVQFYFAQYVLHDIRIVSYMTFFTMGFSILGSAMIPFFSKRLGKKKTYMLACLIWAVSDGIGYFAVHTGVSFAIFTSISYFGNGLITGLNWALISDVVDYGEWKTHVRSEGVVYSSYTYFRKLSLAAAGAIPGLILSLVGYVPNHAQTATALAGIRGLVFIYPVVGALLTLVMMYFYPISESRFSKIMVDLDKRHKDAEMKL